MDSVRYIYEIKCCEVSNPILLAELANELLARFVSQAIECGARDKVESSLIDGIVPRPLEAAEDDEDMHPVPGGGGRHSARPVS